MAPHLRIPLLLLLLAGAGCGAAPEDPAGVLAPDDIAAADRQGAPEPGIVQASQEGENILAIGQVLEIALEGTPGTGYAWEIDADGAPQLARAPSPPGPEDESPGETPQRVGGPTVVRWHFEAVQPGATEVRLVYRRPWEKDEAPEREAVYRIVVQGAAQSP